MPIYAYRCSSCGHQQDVLQKISDAPLTVCPACGAATFAKQLSAPAFQLKGTGWYVTDFRDGKKPGQDKAAREAGDAANGSGDKGSTGDKAAGDKVASDKGATKEAGDKGGSKADAAPKPASPAPSAPAPSGGGAKSGTPG